MPWTIPARPTVGDIDWNAEQEAIWSSLKSFVDGLEGGGARKLLVPKAAGEWLAPNTRGVANGGSAWSTGQQPGTPYLFDQPYTADQFALRVTTLEAASLAAIRFYSSDADGYPLTLVAETTGHDCSSTGAKAAALGANFTFQPGLYWGFIRSNSPGGLVRFQAHTPNEPLAGIYQSIASAPGSSPQFPKVDHGTYGSATTTLSGWVPGDVGSNQCPYIYVRRA